MTKWIEKYIKYLRYEKNYSLHTEISYSTDLKQFADFLSVHFPGVDILAVDRDIARMWIAFLVEGGSSARSVNRKLSSLKSFYKYLLRIGEVSANPLYKVTGPKAAKPLPVFVNEKDMDLLLEPSDEDSFESIRDRVIIELFYVTGIRRAELIGLRDEDVEEGGKSIRVTGKRNKQRIVPVSNGMIEMLNEYKQKRDEEICNQTGYLFVKNDGGQLYPMMVHRIVTKTLGQIPTLAKDSPHVLRHTFATTMLNNGADINAMKELLGHSSLAATEIYTHTSFEELKKIYNKAHPRA
ncbi:tyrosine-type recombinase/integrase [Dysgonomonas sp. 511]|uniref:tyrosine-type recombinase/integrase n=1 Tax=Dysgonomonas sp. 511 TaxID=2302930 RepID=UPI0013D65735|nr:tyrosine-type recombinase/integrase [Dysgonomonas sp. 511]NDV79978.1 recombinase [Dysgonomonas sp. 511]